jgi:hypothetical protein
MADREDGGMDTVKPTGVHAVPRRSRAEPRVRELGERDDAVLAPGQACDLDVHRARSRTRRVAGDAHRAMLGRIA